ncbi:MAG: YihY/virulence factor BrkB family protein [Nitrospirae bacterium]|nr:YihY/virulence factor BrkB family protein [Nitrospirota bacterium]
MKLFWASVVMFVRALFGAFADFRRLGCLSLAASLSFFTLLSFFPMIGLLLYAIGFFVSQDIAWFQFLINFFQGFLPGLGATLAEEVRHVASEQIVGWVGLLAFLWFSGLVFYEVDYAVNVVFGTARTRNALISTLMSVALLGFVQALMIVSYVITQVSDVIVSYAPQMGGIDVMAVAANTFLLGYVLPFVFILVTVMCIYRYLPQNRPTWEQAAGGGLVLALLWELAKHFFSTYVQDVVVYYDRMYGSLLVVVMFLLWVYYSASLFLYGAAVVHRLQRVSEK